MTRRTLPPPLLSELQHWMASAILDSGATDDERGDDGVDAWIASADPALARRRLGAYVGGYPARTHEALCEAFPALRHVVGEVAFAKLAARYRPMIPAGSYSLADVGAALPDRLAVDEIGRDYPFAADLARVEWAVQRAFHATPAPPLDPAPLATWSGEQWATAKLVFQPHVALVSSDWPVVDVWEARETPLEQIDIEIVDRAQSAVVYRSEFRVVCRCAPRGEAVALDALLAGAPLGDAIARLADAGGCDDVSDDDVMGWFAGWMAAGLVVDCRAG